MELIFFLLLFGYIVLSKFIKKVPLDTVHIIDKNGHYYRTVRHGTYLLLPGYEVTTRISEKRLAHSVQDFFDTEDGVPLNISIRCMYHAQNIDETLQLLGSVRRSIDDILKSSVYFAIGGFKFNYTLSANHEVTEKIKNNLIKELNSIGVTLDFFSISHLSPAPNNTIRFKPHISSCISNSGNTHSHENAIKYNDVLDNNDDGPIKFY